MAQRDLIDIKNDNLYDILGVTHDATIREITRSYRKRALKLHPDKNPDPAAHKMFLKLTQIMELLSDTVSRENYDTVLKAREAAKLRTQQLDAKRRKLKESLESKEKDPTAASVKKAEKLLQETINRLQDEGESLLRREEERMRQEFAVKTDFIIADKATLKIKWKCKKDDSSNCGYTENSLRKLLQKYGPVSHIIVNSKRKGSALAIFDSIAAAKICMQKERGLEGSSLSFRMIHETDTQDTKRQSVSINSQQQHSNLGSFSSFSQQSSPGSFTSSFPHQPNPGTFGSFPSFNASTCFNGSSSMTGNEPGGDIDRDYESLTLMRLRQAEERKRLVEEIKAKESEGNKDEND